MVEPRSNKSAQTNYVHNWTKQMRKATVKITGIADYCQSRFHGEAKLDKENSEDYERRTWRNKAHFDQAGHVIIPALAFKKSIAEAAKYSSKQIPGKGKSTYTKHFQAGVLVFNSPTVYGHDGKAIHRDDIKVNPDGSPATGGNSCYRGETLFVPSSGVAGDGKRVHRIFPVVSPGWKCQVDYIITDDTITREVFEEFLATAGLLIGIGAFRVRNQGIWGSFKHEMLDWVDNVGMSDLA